MFTYYKPKPEYYVFRYEFESGVRGVIFDTSVTGDSAKLHLLEEGHLKRFIKVGLIEDY